MRTQVRTSADTRTAAVSQKAARGCGVQCRASARKLAASASTATPPVDDTFVSAADTAQPRLVAPEDMQLPSGQLSDVKRVPSASPADVFRCNGCTDTACQVLLFLTSSSKNIDVRTQVTAVDGLHPPFVCPWDGSVLHHVASSTV